MKCLICDTDISQPEQQFGQPDNPICQSDWLDGGAWVYDEPVIVDCLKRGVPIEDAKKIAVKDEVTDLQTFAESFFVEVLKG